MHLNRILINIQIKEQTVLERRRKPRRLGAGDHTKAGSWGFYDICWLYFTLACVTPGLSFLIYECGN